MLAVCLVPLGLAEEAAEPQLINVALTTLGATAKGSGSPFNRDWPAISALLPPGQQGGTIFGGPLKGGRVDIRLVVPVDIKAVEVVGLDYHGTVQPSGIDVYVDGKFVKHADLPENPGKPQRTPLEARGQVVGIVVTGDHPVRTLPDGSKGPDWGGWDRIRILSTTDVPALMKQVDAYKVAALPANIAPTAGSLAEGPVQVQGEPRVTAGHPCTLWDRQDIDHYREMLKTSQELQTQYAGLKRAMDERMTRPLGIPQPVKGPDGQWLHLPDTQYGPVHTQLALDIANMGAVYALSGEEKYGDYARKLLLAYADAHPGYGIGARPGFNHDPSKVFDQRLGDAIWLIQVARGYDLVHDLPALTAEERKHIEDDLVRASARHIAANSAHLTAPTNWSAIGTLAVLMAGCATDDADLINLALYGPGGSRDNVRGGVFFHFGPQCIDTDGMWAEGAMGYQFMALEALVADAEVLWHRGIDLYRYRDCALKRLFDSPLQYVYPDLKTPAMHDSGYGSIIDRDSFLYEFAYRRYGDPKHLLVLNQTGLHLDAQFQKFPVSVLYDRDPAAPVTATEWKSVNLSGVGYGILRNTTGAGSVSLLLDYGPDRSHGHPDKLNLDLWAFGDRLLPDPGSVWYEEPMYRLWYHTTMAHNTLCVDELEQRPCGAEQLVYGPADSMGIQRARTDEAYAGVTMDRAVFLTPEYLADVFGAFARVPRKMDLCWHIRGTLASDLPLTPFQLAAPLENGYSELTDVRHAVTGSSWSAAFSRGDRPVRFLAAGGEDTEVLVAAGHLGQEQPPTIIQRRQTSSTVYGNVLDFSGAAEGYVRGVSAEGGLDQGYCLVKLDTARGQDLCFVSYRPGMHRAGGLETDAQQALVLREGPEIRAAYIGGGTALNVAGASLRRSEQGLAYLEKAETGAYIVGNPSPAAATVTVTFGPLTHMKAYELDRDGKRLRELPVTPGADGSCALSLGAGSKVEFGAQAAPSVYDHRQEMLRREQEQREASMRKAEEEGLARAKAREEAARANPVPAGTVVAVQAEDFTGQGGGEVTITDQKVAAVGKALLGWDAEGHWLEWTVEAPAEGCYSLTVCYCTELALCERELKVNGEVQEPFGPVVFPSTGGWANGSDDWRLLTVPDPVTGSPLFVKLNAGKNVIRLTNLNGRGVNCDYLLITSPDVKANRASIERLLKAR
jgi:hypothetical protein